MVESDYRFQGEIAISQLKIRPWNEISLLAAAIKAQRSVPRLADTVA